MKKEQTLRKAGVRWAVHTLVGDQVGHTHSVVGGEGQVGRAHSGGGQVGHAHSGGGSGGPCTLWWGGVKWAVHTLLEWPQLFSNSEPLQIYYGQHRRRG